MDFVEANPNATGSDTEARCEINCPCPKSILAEQEQGISPLGGASQDNWVSKWVGTCTVPPNFGGYVTDIRVLSAIESSVAWNPTVLWRPGFPAAITKTYYVLVQILYVLTQFHGLYQRRRWGVYTIGCDSCSLVDITDEVADGFTWNEITSFPGLWTQVSNREFRQDNQLDFMTSEVVPMIDLGECNGLALSAINAEPYLEIGRVRIGLDGVCCNCPGLYNRCGRDPFFAPGSPGNCPSGYDCWDALTERCYSLEVGVPENENCPPSHPNYIAPAGEIWCNGAWTIAESYCTGFSLGRRCP
jgi:hypothetical protein